MSDQFKIQIQGFRDWQHHYIRIRDGIPEAIRATRDETLRSFGHELLDEIRDRYQSEHGTYSGEEYDARYGQETSLRDSWQLTERGFGEGGTASISISNTKMVWGASNHEPIPLVNILEKGAPGEWDIYPVDQDILRYPDRNGTSANADGYVYRTDTHHPPIRATPIMREVMMQRTPEIKAILRDSAARTIVRMIEGH